MIVHRTHTVGTHIALGSEESTKQFEELLYEYGLSSSGGQSHSQCVG